MKLQNLFIIAIFIWLAACKSQPEKVDYKITGVPFNEVKINDNFWLPKIETIRTVTIPASFAKCEETGRVENFIKAAKKRRRVWNYPSRLTIRIFTKSLRAHRIQ